MHAGTSTSKHVTDQSHAEWPCINRLFSVSWPLERGSQKPGCRQLRQKMSTKAAHRQYRATPCLFFRPDEDPWGMQGGDLLGNTKKEHGTLVPCSCKTAVEMSALCNPLQS